MPVELFLRKKDDFLMNPPISKDQHRSATSSFACSKYENQTGLQWFLENAAKKKKEKKKTVKL